MKMTMKNISENLERSYQLFLNRQQPLDFFNDLAGYLDYVFSVPLLKEVFTKQLEVRNAKYEQKWKLEKQAMAEIREAKQKIEKVFKKRKIDTDTLKRFRTSPLFTNSDPGIMQDWEDYESGKIQTGDGGNFRCNRRSDDFNELVGDMAANLYTRGYKEDVKEFLVSDDEYRTYYRRINGPGVISRAGNPNGNFIFSRALPERWEVENLIQTERYAKPWGAFEKLYQFWIAHKNISRGVDAEGTLEEVARALEETKKTDDGKYIIGPDSYDILSMQIDFRNLLGERSSWHKYSISTWRPNRLVVEQIKAAAETIHNIFLRTISEGGELLHPKRLNFDSLNGVLRCGEIKPHSFHRGNRGDKPLLCLFRKLWDERQHIHRGVQKKAGQPFPPEALAAQIGVSKDKVISMLKSITRVLQRFPAEIERENGILLIVTEK